VWTYRTYNLLITTIDSKGELRTSWHVFVTCGFKGLNVNLILGYPWLAAINPLLEFCAGI
jgi:hypothetical protein